MRSARLCLVMGATYDMDFTDTPCSFSCRVWRGVKQNGAEKDDGMDENSWSIDELYDKGPFKKMADSFLQTLGKIRNNPERSKRRLLWELVQNAADTRNRFGPVSIRIEIDNQKFRFSHNGDPFTPDDFIGLIQQTSSKDSQNEAGQTGKFGTGFICTYLLSERITVSGIAAQQNGQFRKFEIELNRPSQKSEELAEIFRRDKRIAKDVFEVRDDKCLPNYSLLRKETDYDTCFTYPLETDGKRRYAIEGINDLVNTLPITLVNQPRIKSVEVVSEGRSSRYICERGNCAYGFEVVFVTVTANGESDRRIFLSYCSNEDDEAGAVRLTVGVDLITKTLLPQDRDVPKLLRDFPLIGSERFHFPYYLNGSRFEPTEDRDGLILNGAEDGNTPAVLNRRIVEKAVDAAIEFNGLLIRAGLKNRWILARSSRPDADMQGETPAWFNALQRKWRSRLLGQELVEVDTGRRTCPLSQLSLPFVKGGHCNPTKEDRRFYELVRKGNFPSEGIIPDNVELYANWAAVVESNPESWPESASQNWQLQRGAERFHYQANDFLAELEGIRTLPMLAKRTGMDEDETVKWLNEILSLLIDEIGKDDIAKRRVFPCQDEGRFCRAVDLAEDKNVPDEFKELWNECFGHFAKEKLQAKLLDRRMNADSFVSGYYDVKTISSNLNKFIEDTHYHNVEMSCRIVGVVNKARQHDEFYQCMKEFFPGKVPAEAKRTEVEGEFNWHPAMRTLIREILLKITRAGSLESSKEWLSLDRLDRFVRLVHEIDGGCFGEMLTAKDIYRRPVYKCFPNQLGEFCALDKVWYDECLRDFSELKELAAKKPIEVDYRKELLHLDSSLRGVVADGGDRFNLKSLCREIDDRFDDYKKKGLDPEEENFKRLIFSLNEICGSDKRLGNERLRGLFPHFDKIKDALLARSLGDEKLADFYQMDKKLSPEMRKKLASMTKDEMENLLNGATACGLGGHGLHGGWTLASEVSDGKTAISGVLGVSDARISLCCGQYDGLSEKEKRNWLMEAKRLVQEWLESKGYEFTKGIGEGPCSQINGVFKDGVEYPLVVHSHIDHGRSFQLNAADLEQLSRPNAVLLVRCAHDGGEYRGIRIISFRDLLSNRERIVFSFSTDNVDVEERLKTFAETMRYFKGLYFDFGAEPDSGEHEAHLRTGDEIGSFYQ